MLRIGIGISRSMISRTALRLTNMKNLPKLDREPLERFSRLVAFLMNNVAIFFTVCANITFIVFFGGGGISQHFPRYGNNFVS